MKKLQEFINAIGVFAMIIFLTWFVAGFAIPEIKRQNRWSKNIDIAKFHLKEQIRFLDSAEVYIKSDSKKCQYFLGLSDYHYGEVMSHVWDDK